MTSFLTAGAGLYIFAICMYIGKRLCSGPPAYRVEPAEEAATHDPEAASCAMETIDTAEVDMRGVR